MDVIHVQDVGVSIDQTVLLEPTSLSVARGTVIAVRGSNGSGKTTLLQVLCGQIEATTGAATVLGTRPNLRDIEFRRKVGAMMGLPPFARDLTILEHATLIGATWGLDVANAKIRAGTVCAEFGLEGLTRRFPHEISSGQRQLAGLALTFMRPFDVLLLDEPEQRLDEVRLQLVIEAIRKRVVEGCTVVVATHSDVLSQALGATVVQLGAPGG